MALPLPANYFCPSADYLRPCELPSLAARIALLILGSILLPAPASLSL